MSEFRGEVLAACDANEGTRAVAAGDLSYQVEVEARDLFVDALCIEIEILPIEKPRVESPHEGRHVLLAHFASEEKPRSDDHGEEEEEVFCS